MAVYKPPIAFNMLLISLYCISETFATLVFIKTNESFQFYFIVPSEEISL